METESAGHGRRDPVVTDPESYRLLWENDDVRVLEYRDLPGQTTTTHDHPNTVLIALSGFRRRLSIGGDTREVELGFGAVQWLPAQSHRGANTGTTPTHTILVELKDSAEGGGRGELGPSGPRGG